MTKPICSLCSSTKSVLPCESCGRLVCKSCRENVDAHDFSFFTNKPELLKHTTFCGPCYDAKVVPERERYQALMERAEHCYFLSKNYRGNVHIFRRYTKRVQVTDCDDRRECILRMAFMAAELGFNAIIEAKVESKKVRQGAYQTATWSGSALPAQIDGERLEASSLKGF